jgi:hypothetical protein
MVTRLGDIMKFMIALLLGFNTLFAVSVTYDVTFGGLSKLGTAKATMEINQNRYKIVVSAKATGLAKVLSGGREEIYSSQGVVVKGLLRPLTYKKERYSRGKQRIRTYSVNHRTKEVTVDTWDRKRGKETRSSERFNYYAKDDILTLFFNLKHYIKTKKDRAFYAIGGNKKDGKVNVVFPKKKELATMKRYMKEEKGEFLKVILNQKIFSSSNGELLINLDSDGLCQKAVLKDVILFGDIVGRRAQ